MADNIIRFARSFQESFQRAQQIELQRQREERFGRQLIANADFQQSQLNLQRQRLDLAERQFKQGPRPLGLRTIQTGPTTSIFDPAEGTITPTGFPSARVAGDVTTLPGKFGLAAKLKQSGLTGTVVNQLIQGIPADLNEEAAEAFLRASDESVLPFLEQTVFGFGKMKFAGIKGRFNVQQEDIAPVFRKFLQDTQFATSTPAQQEGILRAFDESLGADITDAKGKVQTRAVPRDEVEFDLQSPFFQKIIQTERAKAIQELPKPKTQAEFDAIPTGLFFIDTDGQPKVKR